MNHPLAELTKFTYADSDLLSRYLRLKRGTSPLFCLHITWLARGPFYYKEDLQAGFLYIYKKSQIFGRPIFYHMGFPLHVNAVREREAEELLSLLNSGTDVSVSESNLSYLGLSEKVAAGYSRDNTPAEFIYNSADYTSLEGGRWSQWRYAIRQAKENFNIRIFSTDNIPENVCNQLKDIVAAWKGYKDKYVNRHAGWYASDVRKIPNAAVTVFYPKDGDSMAPVYFNVSQAVGNTVFVLDIKVDRDRIQNSSSIAKAAHIFLIGYWRKNIDGEFTMLTGVGDKPYKHDGKTFDLDKNKSLLRPADITPIYKVRASTQQEQ